MPVTSPTILIVAQNGRLTYEAVLLAASLRASAPNYTGKLVVAEPESGPLWSSAPEVTDTGARDLLIGLGADIRSFHSHHFGEAYPIGNKVEALGVLEADAPFIFFDTDTLITGPLDEIAFDPDHPTASMARSATWPEPPLYGPGYNEIWQSIYDRFGVYMAPTLDTSKPKDDWERYLYFNAGWFFARDPERLQSKLIEVMTALRDDPHPELASQALYPWLDQIALPIAIAHLGGGRPGSGLSGLDGCTSCHWRALPLFYAKASDTQVEFLEEIARPNKIKRVLKAYEPFRKYLYQGRGARARSLFDQNNLPKNEQAIRKRLKQARLWMR